MVGTLTVCSGGLLVTWEINFCLLLLAKFNLHVAVPSALASKCEIVPQQQEKQQRGV